MVENSIKNAISAIIISAGVEGNSALAEAVGSEAESRGLVELSAVTRALQLTVPRTERVRFLTK